MKESRPEDASPNTFANLLWRLLHNKVALGTLFLGYILGCVSGSWVTLELFDSVAVGFMEVMASRTSIPVAPIVESSICDCVVPMETEPKQE